MLPAHAGSIRTPLLPAHVFDTARAPANKKPSVYHFAPSEKSHTNEANTHLYANISR
jgi:hypothetical protein